MKEFVIEHTFHFGVTGLIKMIESHNYVGDWMIKDGFIVWRLFNRAVTPSEAENKTRRMSSMGNGYRHVDRASNRKELADQLWEFF